MAEGYDGSVIYANVFWVRQGETGEWMSVLALKGDKGVPGRDGVNGKVYVPTFDGRYLTWKLQSTPPTGETIAMDLKGPQGDVGPAGPIGNTGPQGPVGPKGDTGDGALELAVQSGYEGTARAFYDALAAVVATGETAQEAIALAKKNNHAHLFETQEEHDLWLADPQMTNTLNIGDLLFVKETTTLSIWDGDNEIGFPSTATLDLHIKNKDNPHEVRAEQVPYEETYKTVFEGFSGATSTGSINMFRLRLTPGAKVSRVTFFDVAIPNNPNNKNDITEEELPQSFIYTDRIHLGSRSKLLGQTSKEQVTYVFDPPYVIPDTGIFDCNIWVEGAGRRNFIARARFFSDEDRPEEVIDAEYIDWKNLIRSGGFPYIKIEGPSGFKSVKDALDELYDGVGDETYTKEEVDAKIASVKAEVSEHAERKDNPHEVTAAQVGALTETTANGLYPRFRNEDATTTVGNNHGRNVMASQNGNEGGFYVTGVAGNPPSRKQWLTQYQRDRVRVYTETSGENKDYYWDESPSGDAEKVILRWCDLFAQAVTTVWLGIMRMCNPRIAANADDASKDIALVPNANGAGLQVQFPGGATAMVRAKTGTLATTAEVKDGDASTLASAKAYADGKVAGAYRYKGTVASKEALPASGNVEGDVWNVSADGMNYAWTGTEWDALGASVDLSAYYTKAEVDAGLEKKARVIGFHLQGKKSAHCFIGIGDGTEENPEKAIGVNFRKDGADLYINGYNEADEGEFVNNTVPYKEDVDAALDKKQDKLTAGENVTLTAQADGTVKIDAAGGGSDVTIDTAIPEAPADDHVPSTKLAKTELDKKVDKDGAAVNGTLNITPVAESTTTTVATITVKGDTFYRPQLGTAQVINTDLTISFTNYLGETGIAFGSLDGKDFGTGLTARAFYASEFKDGDSQPTSSWISPDYIYEKGQKLSDKYAAKADTYTKAEVDEKSGVKGIVDEGFTWESGGKIFSFGYTGREGESIWSRDLRFIKESESLSIHAVTYINETEALNDEIFEYSVPLMSTFQALQDRVTALEEEVEALKQAGVPTVDPNATPTMTSLYDLNTKENDVIQSLGQFYVEGTNLTWNQEAEDEGFFVIHNTAETACQVVLADDDPTRVIIVNRCEFLSDDEEIELVFRKRIKLEGMDNALISVKYPKPLKTRILEA